MDMKDKHQRALRLLAVAAFAALSLAVSAPMWQRLEYSAYDIRMKTLSRLQKGQVLPTGSVVVVGLEEASVVKVKPLIFWYPDLGKFLLRMQEYGAFSVGIDMIPMHSLGQNLQNSIKSIDEFEATPANIQTLATIGELADSSLVGAMLRASEHMHVVQGVAPGTAPFYYSYLAFMKNAHRASVRLTEDKDMVVRKQALKLHDDLDSFAHMQYRLRKNADAPYSEAYVDYRLFGSIPYYSFEDVMAGELSPSAFKDKTVLLGYISGYDDIHPTPLGRYIDGVMIHAMAVETMLRGGFIKSTPSQAMGYAITALLMASAVACAYWMRPSWAIASVAALVALYCALSLWLMARGSLLPIFPQVLGPATVFMAYYPYLYVTEQRDKRTLYKTFSYYVDHEFIDMVIDKDVETLLKGEERDLCIFFSDIRDFTERCNTQQPQEIISFLNRYFTLITTCIKKHGGFVNKFLGDGVLAFFGGEHAVDNAIAASREIMVHLEAFNQSAKDMPDLCPNALRIGIGLDYGRVVMGNVGSEQKMDFTVIGPNVNRAARIEGLTKELGLMLLISGEARDMVKDDTVPFIPMGEHNLKGIGGKVTIYEIKY